MDNLTHTLVGATLARTPLGRAGRGATVALILSSNAPDIDIVAALGGSAKYLEWHRGPTHGVLGPMVLALATAGLVWAGRRPFDAKSTGQPASFASLVGLCLIGVAVHIVMDVPTSYGTRLLSPFDWHWFAVDWMPIIDPYLLVILLVGFWVGRRPLKRLKLGSGMVRERNAKLALALAVCLYATRAISHERALNMAPEVFRFSPSLDCLPADLLHQRGLNRWPRPERERQDVPEVRCAEEVAAIPTFGSPFRWRLVAQFPDGYETREVDVIDWLSPPSANPPLRSSIRYPNVWTPTVARAAETATGETFLGFSRFPAARSFTDPTGVTTVRWIDVRFVDGPASRTSLLTALVRLDAKGNVLEEGVGAK